MLRTSFSVYAKRSVSKRFIVFAVDPSMDDPRIVGLMTEMLHNQEQMLLEQKQTNTRLDRLEKQQQTTNLKLQELSVSNLKLADELRTVVQLGERVVRLEAAVFH